MGGGDMVSGAPTAVSGGLIVGAELRELVMEAIDLAIPTQKRTNNVPSWGLGPAGYDVRLRQLMVRQFALADSGAAADPQLIDPMDDSQGPYISLPIGVAKDGRDYVIISPRAAVYAETVEAFDIPDDVLVLPVGKSTYTRHGLALLATPFEPGWRGWPRVTLVNTTDRPIKYYLGGGGMQCLFFRVPGATAYDGRYQDQQPTQDGRSA